MFSVENIQQALKELKLPVWLIYDFRGNNPVWVSLLGKTLWTTRRLYILIPSDGAPVALVHRVDREQMLDFPGNCLIYTNLNEATALLTDLAKKYPAAVTEYSPDCAIPVMSHVDAGTFEYLRGCGYSLSSSADLVQMLTARWSENALTTHREVSKIVAGIKDDAFALIKRSLQADEAITDYDVQQFIMSAFSNHGLETEDEPICSTNERSGNPHYMPSTEHRFTIRPGDWILIDLWARKPGDEHIFSDITWTGFAGLSAPAKHRSVFECVTGGRDAALQLVHDRFQAGLPVYGWEVDDAARNSISAAGYGEFFIHRTGHSLSQGKHVHGLGVNIDNFETRDNRRLIPGIGFTIEPGVYLPEFGVRSEINVYIGLNGPEVTSPIQTEIL